VTLRSGHVTPLDRMAARTRSRASLTDASGSPTMVNPGSPFEMWTSTETGRPTAPLSAAEATVASMPENGRIGGPLESGIVARASAEIDARRLVSRSRTPGRVPAEGQLLPLETNVDRGTGSCDRVLDPIGDSTLTCLSSLRLLSVEVFSTPATRTALERASPTTRCRSSRRTTERCRARRRWQPGRSPSRHPVRR
jgi:hypothetical protein